MRIEQIPALRDNYNYLLVHDGLKEAIVVDPSQGEPIEEWLSARSLRLVEIWNTHHHWDHTGGNLYLQEKTGAQIRGPADEPIPGRTLRALPGESFTFWERERAQILATPGHTLGHIAYHLPHHQALFSGDVIFSMGCGRLFEGTPAQAFSTLQSLSQLPPETKIYGAHEYSLRNAEFALDVEPHNQQLQQRFEQVKKLRAQNQPTVPTTLGEELSYNPFLRAHSPEIRTSLGLEKAQDLEVFTALRKLRDQL